MIRSLLASALAAALALACAPAFADTPTQATIGLNTGSQPQNVDIQDRSGAWLVMGTVNSTTHTFLPLPAAFPALSTGCLYTNSSGVVHSTGLPCGSGTSGAVSSVGLSAPSSIFSVSGSPVTSTGSLALGLQSQNANIVFAGPASGSASAPTFRALAVADLPPAALTVVANAAALQAGNWTNAVDVYLLGYNTPGDGGEGDFHVSGTSCTADLGTIFQDAASNCLFRVGAGVGPVEAAWWGDYPNSSSAQDSAPAISAAITYASATLSNSNTNVYGEKVHLGKGRFWIGAKLSLPNSVKLVGDGMAATQIWALPSLSATAMLTNSDQSGNQEFWAAEGLLINGNYTTMGPNATVTDSCVDLVSIFVPSHLRDFMVTNCPATGLHLRNYNGFGPFTCDNVWVVNSQGDDVLIDQVANPQNQMSSIHCTTLAAEHESAGHAGLHIVGSGQIGNVGIDNFHAEQKNYSTTPGVTTEAILLDGVNSFRTTNTEIDGSSAANNLGVVITGNAYNANIKIGGSLNNNALASYIWNQATGFETAQSYDYRTPDAGPLGVSRPVSLPLSPGSSSTATLTDNVLTVSAVASGTIELNQALAATNLGTVDVAGVTYVPATGVTTITTASPINATSGSSVTVASVTGTGSCSSVNGTFTAQSGTGGTNLVRVLSTGLTLACTANTGTATPAVTPHPIEQVAYQAFTSATYNSGTGALVLTMPSSNLIAGSTVTILASGLTGTGAFASLSGTWPVASISGATVNLTATTGFGSAALTAGYVSGGAGQYVISGYQCDDLGCLSGATVTQGFNAATADLSRANNFEIVAPSGTSTIAIPFPLNMEAGDQWCDRVFNTSGGSLTINFDAQYGLWNNGTSWASLPANGNSASVCFVARSNAMIAQR